MDTTHELAEELRLAVRRFMARLRQESSGDELTQSQRAVIARLDAQGPSTIAALARAEAVRPQSMGATVAAIEAEGLARRSQDPRDGRRALISLTDAGRRTLSENRARRQEWLEGAMETRLSPAELDTIRDAVAVINRLVEG
jgi:DNA-binding MarR family transcriptional regulator